MFWEVKNLTTWIYRSKNIYLSVWNMIMERFSFTKCAVGKDRRENLLVGKILCYLLRCRSAGLIPPSILKSSVTGTQAENVLRKTEFKLLWERIRHTVFTLGVINRKCEDLETDIKYHFSRHMADKSEHRRCKSRQVNKYDRLKGKSSSVEKNLSKSTKREVGG